LRFKKAVRVGDTIHFKGWLAGREKRLLSAGAEARDENGEIVATARAKCLLIEIEKGSA
jgi:acyl-CoA thioesterase FadM